jgi:hypothetical protein
MSVVGARPPIPYEVEEYDVAHRRRLDMKPGITGLWQVSGRSRLSFEEWCGSIYITSKTGLCGSIKEYSADAHSDFARRRSEVI